MAGRLAIVLSGGGAKGAFQVGVLDALINNHGVKPKIVVGTSTGAIQALGVAQNDVAGLVAVWSAIKGNGDIYTGRAGIIGGLLGDKALYGTAPLRKLLKKFYDPVKIAASDVELRLGVVSLQTGEFQLVAQNAPGLDNWVYASCAMPVFFDPLQTSDKQQWVDGGVRDVTPLGAALDLKPSGVLVIRASPPSNPASVKRFGSLVPIGLRAVTLLQSEVSRNDLQNAKLINDMLATRIKLFDKLTASGMAGQQARDILAPLDDQLADYDFAPIEVIQPDTEFSDTLEFDPKKIEKAIKAGRDAVDANWATIQPLVS